MTIRLITADCRDALRQLPDESVHCVVTSPPYWGLRDYGTNGQIGLELSYLDYVSTMVDVFREVRRVLRDDGTLWLNLGDSYANKGNANPTMFNSTLGKKPGEKGCHLPQPVKNIPDGLKQKDLCGIPWRVAFALQADGWYLRQDIVWSKPNPMPESVTDRCTKAHEYIFLLSKRQQYYYDQEAIAEPSDHPNLVGKPQKVCYSDDSARRNDGDRIVIRAATRNKRSVWEVATAPFSEAHFATFPPALIEPCILAGCSKDCCAKCGAPWMRVEERIAPDGTRVVVRASDRHAAKSDGTPLIGDNRFDIGVRASWNSGGVIAERRTLSWSPFCSCNADTVPGIVLDPFAGAGTTGLVADRLGRNAILIELNPKYAEMAKRRIYDDAPLFANVDEYNATDDFARSIDEAYAAIRERKAAGGKGWPNDSGS